MTELMKFAARLGWMAGYNKRAFAPPGLPSMGQGMGQPGMMPPPPPPGPGMPGQMPPPPMGGMPGGMPGMDQAPGGDGMDDMMGGPPPDMGGGSPEQDDQAGQPPPMAAPQA